MKATTEARAAATRQRLAEAEAAQEAAQAAATAAQRDRQKKEYKPGKMSAEEKSARLAEMMGNAQQHEQQRLERIQQVSLSTGAMVRCFRALICVDPYMETMRHRQSMYQLHVYCAHGRPCFL